LGRLVVLGPGRDHFGLNIVHVEGEQRFLDALAGEAEPEAKRKIIGRVFVEVFDEEALRVATATQAWPGGSL
jgi:GMP synthase PP-ATPase subunit